MKSRFLLIFCCLIVFNQQSFPQDSKAKLIQSFGFLQCSYFINYVALNELRIPDSKIYVIYYEGKYTIYNPSRWNRKTQRYESSLVNPRRGDGLNRAKEVEIFLTENDFAESSITLINGGYRDDLTLEVWLAPKDSLPPKPSQTVSEKEITFRKGKAAKPRHCSRIYDGL